MKLVNVFAGFQTYGKLTQLKVNPGLAYKILKYARLLSAEYEVTEKTRVALIHELTDTKDGEDATIENGTKAHEEYVKRFSAVLDVDSDLNPSDMKFDDVLSALSADQSNVLSAQEISVLEPFFTA